MADRVWTNGNATGILNDALNWDTGLPAAGDKLIFNGAVSNDGITVDVVAGIYGNIEVKGNYTGTITLQVAIEFAAGDIGNVSASNCTFSGAYVVTFATLDVDTGDALTLASGACITIEGALTCDGTIAPSTGSIIYVDDGTVTITGVLGTATTDYDLTIRGDLAVSSGQLIAPDSSGTFLFYAGYTWNTPTTFTHSSGKTTFLGSDTTTIGNNSTGFYNVDIANFTTVASGNYNITIAGNLDIGGGVSGTFTTGTGTKRIDGTLNIGTGASFGTAATAYTLDLNGNLLTSTGTLIAPNATGSFTFAGASWKTPTTFTNSSGTVTFDLAGTTTLGNDSTGFYAFTINTGATLDTSAASSFALTASNVISLSGTFTTNASALSIATGVTTAYGLTILAGGVFTGGNGTHTIGSINSNTATSTCTMTSGICTINGSHILGNGNAILLSTTSTFTASGGGIIFTNTATTYIFGGGKSLHDGTFNGSGSYLILTSITFGGALIINFSVTSKAVATSGGTITVTELTTVTAGGLTSQNVSFSIFLDGGLTINGGFVSHAGTGYYRVVGAFLLSSGTYTHTVNTISSFSGPTWQVNAGTTFTVTSGTTKFYGGGAITVTMLNVVTPNFNNIVTDTAGTSVTQGSAITVTTFFTMATTILTTWDTSAANSYAFTVGSTFGGNGGVFNANNSTLTCNGGSNIFGNNITFNGGTGSHSFVNVSLAACTFHATSGNTILRSFAATTFTTFNANGGTLVFSGTATIDNNSGENFNNVSTNDGVATTTTLARALTISGTLVVNTSGVFNTSVTNYTLTVNGATSVTGTLIPNLSIITINGTVVINAGGIFGTDTAYTLDINDNLLASAGTLIAPNLSGLFTYSGATWNTPTTFTQSTDGYLQFDRAGTTSLGNNSTQFCSISISNDATLDTLTYNITMSEWLFIGDGTSGTFTATSGTISIGSLLDLIDGASMSCGTSNLIVASVTTIIGATFDGGTGTNDMNSISIDATSTWTATSSVTTCFSTITIAGAFIHSNGEIIFDDSDSMPVMWDITTNDQHFYDFTLSGTGSTKRYTIYGTLYVDANMSISTSQSQLNLAPNDNNVYVSGNVTFASGCVVFHADTGWWYFDGTTIFTDSNSPVKDIGNISITGLFTLASGIHVYAFELGATGIFTATGAYDIEIDGATCSIVSGGLWTAGTGTVSFTLTTTYTDNSVVPQNIGLTAVSGDLTLGSDMKTDGITITGSLTGVTFTLFSTGGIDFTGGLYDIDSSTLYLNGTGQQTITMAGNYVFNITVNNTHASEQVIFADHLEFATGGTLEGIDGQILFQSTINLINGTLKFTGAEDMTIDSYGSAELVVGTLHRNHASTIVSSVLIVPLSVIVEVP
ncbi:beta strand repeat-containing protein [Sulfuricurvum sp.]|uniref:beta strand repeat-containing protein n=1 Tax=Sulfuricurvum sp. TaxID=2025608 RepID=UPI003563EC5D